jgi:hypothetical protein
MKKSLLVAALIAAACSTAFAGEVKQTNAPAPVVKAQTMTDTDMDKVTAGSANGTTEMCNAHNCQWVGTGGQSWHRAANHGAAHFNQL